MVKLPINRPRVTATLLRRLFKAPDFGTFIKENEGLLAEPQLSDHLLNLCRQYGEGASQIILRAGIDRTYGHQIFNGTRNPSRDKIIQLAFGFRLDVDNTQELLKVAQKSLLYPRILRDAAILRCIHDRRSIMQTQDLLQQLGLTLLGGEDKNG